MNRAINAVLIVSLSLVLFGCSAKTGMNSKNLGSFKENPEITRLYASYTINPDYNYFYYGREMQPDAILGVMKSYRVQSEYWHQVELTEDQLEKWVVWGDRDRNDRCASRRYSGRYQGADIFDPDGKIIGNWYSKRDWGIFEFPGESTVIPHPPRNKDGWSLDTCT